jgi:hypothetical protein
LFGVATKLHNKWLFWPHRLVLKNLAGKVKPFVDKMKYRIACIVRPRLRASTMTAHHNVAGVFKGASAVPDPIAGLVALILTPVLAGVAALTSIDKSWMEGRDGR